MMQAHSSLILGTRGSDLALWQANYIKSRIEHAYPKTHIEIKVIHTTGDKQQKKSIAELGGTSVFIKELENALLNGEVDICVHSLKDMSYDIPDALCLAAIPKRENAHDVLISADAHLTLATLPPHARVATGSPRRTAQLLHMRPDICVCPIRGNVDTRVKRICSQEYDAGILAYAGVKRLGLEEHITQEIPFDMMIPAAGQAALACECRKQDTHLIDMLATISDKQTTTEVQLERAIMKRLGAGCKVPCGIFARANQKTKDIQVQACIATEDGKTYLSCTHTDTHIDTLTDEVVDELLQQGALDILESYND